LIENFIPDRQAQKYQVLDGKNYPVPTPQMSGYAPNGLPSRLLLWSIMSHNITAATILARL
jgi:hypothetical protein